MKKIFFVILFGWSALFGAYNECVTDIYFGNGVWNDYEGASNGRDALARYIVSKVYHGDYNAFKSHHFTDRSDPNLNKNIVLLAFNWTGSSPNDSLSFKTKIIDLIETFYQLKDNNQLEGYSLYDMLKAWLTQDPTDPLSNVMWDKIDDIVADYSRTIEGSNLIKMIEDYETISLKKSHRVLLVAHSQGNLFGNEVYDNLISWEQGYFKMVSVGTPASSVLGQNTPYTTLKCDKVINDNLIGGIPGHLPGNIECTGEEKSSDGHQFVASYLSNHISLPKIMSDISSSLDTLANTSSQWITYQEIERGTCDYRISVKHRFDPALEIGEKVYPFAPNKKLYQVNGAYVKATCGGTDFTDDWADKKENECWMINNLPKEKIVKKAECAFEVAVNEGEYTCYNEDTFFTYVHTTNYGAYTFHVHYDDVNTSWTACRHCTQGWTNSYGDRLEIGNGAGGSWIHQAINFYVHIVQ